MEVMHTAGKADQAGRYPCLELCRAALAQPLSKSKKFGSVFVFSSINQHFNTAATAA